MRPAFLAFVLLSTAGFSRPGDVTVELDGKAKLVVERMVLQSGNQAPVYKSSGGTAKLDGEITIGNGLSLPVTNVRVLVQLRTATGAAPRTGGHQQQAMPETRVDVKLKQPLAPGESIKLPLHAEIFVSFDGGLGGMLPTDQALKQARTVWLEVEAATIGPREIELVPTDAPAPPPPSEYEGYLNKLDREFTAKLAHPTKFTATLVARRPDGAFLRKDNDAPVESGPLGYRLLLKGAVPVVVHNTGLTGVRNITITAESTSWGNPFGGNQTLPDPAIDPGEERELEAKLDHDYRFEGSEIPSSLPMPLAGRSSYRTIDPSPVRVQSESAILEAPQEGATVVAPLHPTDEVIEIGRPESGFTHVRKDKVVGWMPEAALRASFLRAGKEIPLRRGVRVASWGTYLPACELGFLGVKTEGPAKGSHQYRLRRGGTVLAFNPGVKEGYVGSKTVTVSPVAYGDPTCAWVHSSTLTGVLGAKL